MFRNGLGEVRSQNALLSLVSEDILCKQLNLMNTVLLTQLNQMALVLLTLDIFRLDRVDKIIQKKC